MTTNQTFDGADLKKIRKEKGLSLREASRLSGVTLNTLSRIEMGTHLGATGFGNVVKYCSALGFDVTLTFRAGKRVDEIGPLSAAEVILLESQCRRKAPPICPECKNAMVKMEINNGVKWICPINDCDNLETVPL